MRTTSPTTSSRPPAPRASRARRAALRQEAEHRALALADRRARDDRPPRPADADRARRRASASSARPRRASSRASRRPASSTRTADPADRRSSLISITPGGRALLAAVRDAQGRLPRRSASTALAAEDRADAGARRRDPRAACSRMTAERSTRTFSSLRVPNYRRYFAGQVVSITGNWMQIVAEMWLIVQLTGTGVGVGITAGLQFLPILLFGAWGGVLADRLRQAQAADRHAGADGGPRAHAVGADRRRARSRPGWSSRSCSCAARCSRSTTRRGSRS